LLGLSSSDELPIFFFFFEDLVTIDDLVDFDDTEESTKEDELDIFFFFFLSETEEPPDLEILDDLAEFDVELEDEDDLDLFLVLDLDFFLELLDLDFEDSLVVDFLLRVRIVFLLSPGVLPALLTLLPSSTSGFSFRSPSRPLSGFRPL